MVNTKKTKLKKKLRAEIVSILDDKTCKVRVQTSKQHPIYKKIIKSHKKYLVGYNKTDDIKTMISIGDKVTIEETRPKSKTKNFVILK